MLLRRQAPASAAVALKLVKRWSDIAIGQNLIINIGQNMIFVSKTNIFLSTAAFEQAAGPNNQPRLQHPGTALPKMLAQHGKPVVRHQYKDSR